MTESNGAHSARLASFLPQATSSARAVWLESVFTSIQQHKLSLVNHAPPASIGRPVTWPPPANLARVALIRRMKACPSAYHAFPECSMTRKASQPGANCVLLEISPTPRKQLRALYAQVARLRIRRAVLRVRSARPESTVAVVKCVEKASIVDRTTLSRMPVSRVRFENTKTRWVKVHACRACRVSLAMPQA